MLGYTGYITSSGYDLSLIFQGGTGVTATGFFLENGRDINTIFKALTANQGFKTGLIYSAGLDLNTLFNAITPIPLAIQGCCLWMDSNDTSKISPAPSNNSTINTWTDKSTNAYVFTSPSTSTAKPTFISNSQNGKSTIKFASATLQYFIGNTASKNFALNTSSYALFAVFQKTSGTNGSIYNKSLFGAALNRILLTIDPNLNCGFSHDNASGKISNTTNTITTYQIVSVIINRYAGLDKSYVNGLVAGTYSYTPNSTTNFGASTYDTLIGAYNNSTGTGTPQADYYLNGNICEIISYKNTYDMTDATRQTVEGYLAYRWGLQSLLPLSHPYANLSPY